MTDAASSIDAIVALLTLAIGEAFAATPDARRLLEERPDLELPPLLEMRPPKVLKTPKEIAPEIWEQRRVLREQEKIKRRREPDHPGRRGERSYNQRRSPAKIGHVDGQRRISMLAPAGRVATKGNGRIQS